MSWFSNLIGDVTKGVEEVVPGAKQIDQWLNKVGIGPQTLADPLHPSGWAGDIEHGTQQALHSPAGRALEEAAAIAAAAYFAPELLGTIGGDFSAADMEAIAQAGAEYTGETAGATSFGADLAAETATAADATTAGTAAAQTAPGMMQELAVNAPAYVPGTGGQGLYASLNMLPVAAQAATAAQPGRTPQLKNAMDVQISDLPAAATPDLLSSFAATTPGIGADAGGGAANVLGSTAAAGGGGTIDDATYEAYQMLGGVDDAGNPVGGSWLSNFGKYLTTPKGALTAGMLGMSGLNMLRKPALPDSAKQAAALAGPAAANAQSIITTGGYGSPLWGQQKASIDASIDQQIQDATAAIQQTMQNTSGQGSNSAAVQAQIADVTGQLETQRQLLYQQALQQNVSQAMSELSNADQVLMNVAQIQY
ncbi:MAG TPA: hypothetical protein VF764_02690, partial [Steroidobacteraceae bacterium]